MERESLEQQLFSWKDWFEEGPMAMQFSDVELKVPVGPYSIGTHFPSAFIMGDISVLVSIDEAGEEHTFDLKMTVGEAVDLPAAECGHECQHHH